MKKINLYHMAQLIANMKKKDKELLGYYILAEEGMLDNEQKEIQDKKSLELQATELFIKGWQEENQLLELVRENHDNIDLKKEIYEIDDSYILTQFSSILNSKTNKIEFYFSGTQILFKYFKKDNTYGLKIGNIWFNKKLKKLFAYWLLTKCKYINKIRLEISIGSYDISLININGNLIEIGLNNKTAYFKKINKQKFKNLYYKKLAEEKQIKLDNWLDKLAYKREMQKENIYPDEDITFGDEFIDQAIEEISRCFDILKSYTKYPELKDYIDAELSVL